MSPCAIRSASRAASFPSVLRPGAFFTCAALAGAGSNSPSDRMGHTGFQETPVASITIGLHPCADSHADKAMRSAVVVLNVRASRLTSPSLVWRAQATTLSLWTSSPAQSACRTSLFPPPPPPAWSPG